MFPLKDTKENLPLNFWGRGERNRNKSLLIHSAVFYYQKATSNPANYIQSFMACGFWCCNHCLCSSRFTFSGQSRNGFYVTDECNNYLYFVPICTPTDINNLLNRFCKLQATRL